jgi:hypothetical protein
MPSGLSMAHCGHCMFKPSNIFLNINILKVDETVWKYEWLLQFGIFVNFD